MKINSSIVSGKNITGNMNFSSRQEEMACLILLELPNDTFEKVSEEDDDIVGGPLGHPHTGRPVGLSADDVKRYEENMSLLEWFLNPERKLYKRPKTFIGKLFSLGGNNFDDKVSKFHAEAAKNTVKCAKTFLDKDIPISIPIGDINGDGVVDTIVSGINKAIDITGDGKADVIGTLIDVTGDGKADFVRDQLGNLIKVNGDIAKVIGDSKFGLEDLKAIPEIITSLLSR